MKTGDDSVRAWVGLDPLQAEMMKQMLTESGIQRWEIKSHNQYDTEWVTKEIAR